MGSQRSGQGSQKTIIRLLSFNVRQDVESDGGNRWENRRDKVVDVFRTWAPDIMGLQEPYRHQLDYILSAFPDYACIGVGRDDGREAGEFSPILFNKTRFAALEGGTFWLSETPDQAGSISWGCRHPRICTWARLSDRQTYQAFYVYNTHLDNESLEAREKGMALIVGEIRNRRAPQAPVILSGDFNAPPHEQMIIALCSKNSPAPIDAFASLSPADPARGTYHGFTGKPLEARIDYIFVSPEWKVTDCRILAEPGPAYSSDHFPIAAVLES